MAKRQKTESVLSREARKHQEAAGRPASTVAAVKNAVVKAAATVAEVVEKHVVRPVAKAVRPKKAKKARFVREKKEKQEVKATAQTPRSKTASGKMMTKNLAEAPREEPVPGMMSND